LQAFCDQWPSSHNSAALRNARRNCEDDEIRAGVRASLADKYHRLIALRRKREQLGWTSKQWVDDYALRTLNRHRQHWTNYNDGQTRQAALQRFYEYAYRWY
jgi:hypothetical protein